MNATNHTPLHFACKAGDVESVELLMNQYDCHLDVSRRNDDNLTPFELADGPTKNIAKNNTRKGGCEGRKTTQGRGGADARRRTTEDRDFTKSRRERRERTDACRDGNGQAKQSRSRRSSKAEQQSRAEPGRGAAAEKQQQEQSSRSSSSSRQQQAAARAAGAGSRAAEQSRAGAAERVFCEASRGSVLPRGGGGILVVPLWAHVVYVPHVIVVKDLE